MRPQLRDHLPVRDLRLNRRADAGADLLSKQSRERSKQEAAKKYEASGRDINRVLEKIEYGDDFLAARRHVVHGLTASCVGRNIVAAWNGGERF